MRTLTDLFKLMKANKQLFTSCLCTLTTDMFYHKLITRDEWQLMTTYLSSHRPTQDSKFYDKNRSYSVYYWAVYQWEPRLAWINYQIHKLSKRKKNN